MELRQNRLNHSKEHKIPYNWASFGVVKVHIHLGKNVGINSFFYF